VITHWKTPFILALLAVIFHCGCAQPSKVRTSQSSATGGASLAQFPELKPASSTDAGSFPWQRKPLNMQLSDSYERHRNRFGWENTLTLKQPLEIDGGTRYLWPDGTMQPTAPPMQRLGYYDLIETRPNPALD
jgi:hypothetical protein